MVLQRRRNDIFKALAFAVFVSLAKAFQPMPIRPSPSLLLLHDSPESVTSKSTTDQTLSLTKPLGLILEEVEEGQAAGVFVKEVGEGGSAFSYAESLVGAKLATVQDEDVSGLTFDSVMDKIINAPETVKISFISGADYGEDEESPFPVGTPVKITVRQKDKDDLIMSVEVGDNLRKALIENGFEVYQGIKQKLGNCGGAGQCTFCAMDVLESEGWAERSDYEDKKLRKNPNARLSCLNNVQGPAVICKAER